MQTDRFVLTFWKPDGIFAQADIDGGLVGGASLKADFGKIVNYK